MPAVITRGTFSAKAFGFTGRTATPVYVEDVFSTYLYTGTGAALAITNGIDLSTKGGLVWLKQRTGAANNFFFDTARGPSVFIRSDLTNAQLTVADTLTGFTTSGFTLGADASVWATNQSSLTYASWTFRKQPKFFDVVTYAGTGSARTIAHNLGATPGMIIVKRTDVPANWQVYHVGLTSAANSIQLNLTAAQASATTVWNSTAPTSTVFSVGTDATVNASGGTYVAYIYANQAGGFGLSGSDSVVACGSYTGNGSASGPTITLGWEPQFVMIKVASAITSNWLIFDNMRGIATSGNASYLYPNSSAAELSAVQININATGFSPTTATGTVNASGSTYIYLAIRRGPMKVPTSGTSVFSPVAATGTSIYDITFANSLIPDLILSAKDRLTGGSYNSYCFNDRLRGLPQDMTGVTIANNPGLISTGTNAEATVAAPSSSNYLSGSYNSRAVWGGGWSSYSGVFYGLKRAPGFFDEVCYTGTGVATTQAHNLGVVPELMIVKSRSAVNNWACYSSFIGNAGHFLFNTASAAVTTGSVFWNTTTPTSTVFSIGVNANVNTSAVTYVAYLFATCPGVSKVGSYTGTGAAQNINCGFSASARYVLIKRTDSTGDWYVYDSARGISSGNDPYLLMNSSAAEVTGTNYVDTFASGFALTATAPAALNANGGSYIFLAIA